MMLVFGAHVRKAVLDFWPTPVYDHIMSQGHDARYKWVFSHPLFVEKFLRSFVRLPFVKKLNFEAMERVDKEFVSEEFRTLESDIVYKVPYRESCIYIFLLIEFQSTVDKTMPFRFLRYTGELYRFAKPGAESGLYPATFPILLYNGDDEWNVPCNTAELIEKSIPAEFIPRFRYFPVLINQFSKRSLVKIRNVVSGMFYGHPQKTASLPGKNNFSFKRVPSRAASSVVNRGALILRIVSQPSLKQGWTSW